MTGPGAQRRALVTGANGGLGRAIAARLADDGHEVVTLDVADADIVVDLGRDEIPEGALDEIDICVSNAGIVDILSPAHRISREKWDRDLAVNLTGAFRVAQACLGGMRRRRYGRIVLMSSMAATIGGPGQVAYSASKAGLLGAMRAIAVENAALGITANAILPGVIETAKVRAMPAEVRERVATAIHPAARLGEPEEVAHLVSFLASARAGYVTGQAVGIDGGMALNRVSLGNPDKDPHERADGKAA